jgi:hypothetical protein
MVTNRKHNEIFGGDFSAKQQNGLGVSLLVFDIQNFVTGNAYLVTGNEELVTGYESSVTGNEELVTGNEESVTGYESLVTGNEEFVTGNGEGGFLCELCVI